MVMQPQFNSDAKFIQLDIDATQFDSAQKISAPLQGDLTSILNKLVPALTATGYKVPSDWLDAIAQDTLRMTLSSLKELKLGKLTQNLILALSNLLMITSQEHPDTYL